MPKPCISVVLRTHDIRRLPLLRRAIFSLAVQRGVDVETIVVTQRFSQNDLATIKAAAIEALGSRMSARLKVVNVEREGEDDLRGTLLNQGFAASTSRYLAMLDDDDLMYHTAYQRLIGDLQKSSAAVAFGRCVRVMGSTYGKTIVAESKDRPWLGASILELLIDNFCPIHSYVIDRTRVDQRHLVVDTDFPYLEDYRMLLRLASESKFSFDSMNTDVCEYWFYSDGLNTTSSKDLPFSQVAHTWRKAYVEAQRLKSETNISISMLDFEAWFRSQIRAVMSRPIGSSCSQPLNAETLDLLHNTADRLRLFSFNHQA